jgi:hypothetical protein
MPWRFRPHVGPFTYYPPRRRGSNGGRWLLVVVAVVGCVVWPWVAIPIVAVLLILAAWVKWEDARKRAATVAKAAERAARADAGRAAWKPLPPRTDALGARLAGNPGFIAHELAELAGRGIDARAVLRVDAATLYRLSLCRMPRPDRWTADVERIAAEVAVPAAELAALLESSRRA